MVIRCQIYGLCLPKMTSSLLSMNLDAENSKSFPMLYDLYQTVEKYNSSKILTCM